MRKRKGINRDQLAEQLEQLLVDGPRGDEKRRLLHELQVHQIELEMQNQELERTQAELEESRNHYAELYDFAPVGYLSFDKHGIIRQLNLHAATLLGEERARIIDRPFAAFTAADERRNFHNYLRDVFAGDGKIRRLLRIGRSPRPVLDVHLEGVVAHDPTLGTAICRAAMFDVSESVRSQQQLREQAAVLALADRRKNEFLALLGHELRNPLTPIYNTAQILQHQLPGTAGDSHTWGVNLIVRQTEHLLRLVDDLLDIGRITHGRLETKKAVVEINDVLDQALEAVEPQAAKRGHTLQARRAPHPLYVHGDITRLVQATVNLLTNAVRYTEPGGHIDVSVRREDTTAFISVRDNGRGLSHEALTHIFEPLYQSPTLVNRPHGGLGVGLMLTRELVRLHGGDVLALSAGVDAGSEFIISLPLVPAPASEDTAVDESRAPAPRRVLIVDDEPEVAASMVALLEMLGHCAQAAQNGADGLIALDDFRPDLVFLDIGMPDMDGYEVARRMRQRYPTLPLIALSGYGQKDASRNATGTAFNAFLLKPAKIQEIERALRA